MLTYAQELQHAFSLARALFDVATLHKLRGEADAAQERAEAALAIVTEQGFGLNLGAATFTRGWALAEQGQHEEGIAQMRQGLAAWRATGAELTRRSILPGWPRRMGGSDRPRRGYACWPRRWPWWTRAIAATRPSCIVSRASCCYGRPSRTRPRRKPASSRPSPWPAASRPSRGSCGRRMSLSSAVAAAGQARRSPPAAGRGLWLVHRRVRHPRPPGGQGLARCAGVRDGCSMGRYPDGSDTFG